MSNGNVDQMGPSQQMGGGSVVPPHSSIINDNMTTINSSLQSSCGGVSIGGHPRQMQMAPMNLSGDMNNTIVSMHSQQGMQQQMRPMMV